MNSALAQQIISSCATDGYDQPDTLAVLTLAIDEQWTAIPAGFLTQLDAERANGGSPADCWLAIATMKGLPTSQWQAFKTRLYTHIDEAYALYLQPEDPLMALTDAQAQQLVTDIAQLKVDVAQIKADAADTRTQLRGPSDLGWPQLGKNNHNQNLSFIDAVGRIKDKLFGTNNAVS